MISNINLRFKKSNTGFILFLAFSALMLVHLLFTFSGFYGNDDINYARYAAQLLHGGVILDPANHYALRWTCIYTTAFFFQLFGINEVSSALFSFTSLIGSAFIIHKIVARQSVQVLLYTYILFFLSFMVVFYVHRLLPDTGICFLVLLAYFFYYKQKFEQQSTILMALGFSFSLFLAVLTKESIIITLPLWLYFIVTDCMAGKRIRFWGWVLAFSAILIAGYLYYWFVETGDWLFRYHALMANHEAGGGQTYQALGWLALSKRLVFELWNSFLLSGDFQYLVFAVGSVVYRRTVFETERQWHICLSFFILLLCANFMSYSLSGYNPLLPDPRHYMFLLPFAAVAGGYMIKAYLRTPEKYSGLVWMFVIADLFLLFSEIGFTKYVYILITLLLLFYRIAHKYGIRFFTSRLMVCGLILVFGLNFVNGFVRPRYPYYFDQKRLLEDFSRDVSKPSVVIGGDGLTAELSEFMLRFRMENIQFVDPAAGLFTWKNDTDYFLLVNRDYDKAFNINTAVWINQFKLDESNVMHRENNVVLYRIATERNLEQ